MKLTFLTLFVSGWICWDMLYDRVGFAARHAVDRVSAIGLAAVFWTVSVQASGLTPGLAALLQAPAIVALAYTTWSMARSMRRSWRLARASRHA